MLQVGILKTIGRVASLILLLVATMGPWFIDSHPATEESCSQPLVWLGNSHCACRVSLMAAIIESVKSDHSLLWLLCLPTALPFLSTLLLLLGGERRYLWNFHLAAWVLVAIYSLFLFFRYWNLHPALIQWGAGLGGVVAVAILVGEILVHKSPTLSESS